MPTEMRMSRLRQSRSGSRSPRAGPRQCDIPDSCGRRRQVELVVPAVGEPTRDHRGGKPGPPPPLEAHPHEYLGYAESYTSEGQRKENYSEMIDFAGVTSFDGIED